jgi:hypothetical protein
MSERARKLMLAVGLALGLVAGDTATGLLGMR